MLLCWIQWPCLATQVCKCSHLSVCHTQRGQAALTWRCPPLTVQHPRMLAHTQPWGAGQEHQNPHTPAKGHRTCCPFKLRLADVLRADVGGRRADASCIAGAVCSAVGLHRRDGGRKCENAPAHCGRLTTRFRYQTCIRRLATGIFSLPCRCQHYTSPVCHWPVGTLPHQWQERSPQSAGRRACRAPDSWFLCCRLPA